MYKNTLNECFVLPLQELNGVLLKIRHTPSFRTRRYFSHHSNRGNSLQDYPSFAGQTIGTRIDRDNSLIMPLRLRGGYATECHAFSYYPSSSALPWLAALRLVFRLRTFFIPASHLWNKTQYLDEERERATLIDRSVLAVRDCL